MTDEQQINELNDDFKEIIQSMQTKSVNKKVIELKISRLKNNLLKYLYSCIHKQVTFYIYIYISKSHEIII